MKILAVIISLLISASASADTYVNGYMRGDGTYVAPHMRSSPDAYRFNNYGSQTNGGYQRDEFSSPPAYNQSNPSYGYGDAYQNRQNIGQEGYGSYQNRW